MTIIHSLWQGLLVYFVLKLVLLAGYSLPASKKYWLALTGLVVVAGWFIYTLTSEVNIYNWLAQKPVTTNPKLPLMLQLPVNIPQFNEQALRYYYNIEKYLPYITVLYVAGLLFNTSRLILARKQINTIRQGMTLDMQLQRTLDKFAEMLNIDIKVNIGLSKLVDVPCMVGYFKPLILLPLTLSTYLTAEEIESILLHELAHVKRNDYLLNIAQQVITTLLFFNPFAHLISQLINQERENSCDDIVVQMAPSPFIYAGALLKIEEGRQTTIKLAMAATGKKYLLLNRIERIMKTKNTIGNTRQVLLPISLFIIAIISMAVFNPQIANGKISVANISPAIKKAVAAITPPFNADTTPKKKDASAKTAGNQSSQSLQALTDITNDHSNQYQVLGFGDPEMDEIVAEINKHKKIVNDYFETPEYKTLVANKEKSKLVEGFYDNDTLKNIMLSLDEIDHRIKSNWGGQDGKDTELYKQRTELGSKVGAYYSSDEFKSLNEALQKKYNINPNKIHSEDDDANYRKYEAELTDKLPADIKEETAGLKTLSDQLYQQVSSPEFKAAFKQLKLMLDSMKSYYKKPHIKQYENNSDDYQQYSRLLLAYKNNPEITREQQIIRDLSFW